MPAASDRAKKYRGDGERKPRKCLWCGKMMRVSDGPWDRFHPKCRKRQTAKDQPGDVVVIVRDRKQNGKTYIE